MIGNQRTYPLSSEERLDEERTQYIRERYSCTLSTNNHFSDVIASTSLFAPDMKHCSNAYDSMVQDTSAEMNSLASSKWLAGFQPREKIQKVRNCATLPRDFTDDVVLQVAKELLKINQDSSQNSNDEDNAGNWNKGGRTDKPLFSMSFCSILYQLF